MLFCWKFEVICQSFFGPLFQKFSNVSHFPTPVYFELPFIWHLRVNRAWDVAIVFIANCKVFMCWRDTSTKLCQLNCIGHFEIQNSVMLVVNFHIFGSFAEINQDNNYDQQTLVNVGESQSWFFFFMIFFSLCLLVK